MMCGGETKLVSFLIFLSLLTQVSCRGKIDPPKPDTEESPILTTHISQTATITPSSITQPTPSPLLTETPSPTVVLSPTATPPPTFQMTPTLEPDASYKYVLNLLKTNGGCTLPCLIGITPGKTTWSEVQAIFTFLGKDPPTPWIIKGFGLKRYRYQYLQEGQSTLLGFSFYVTDDSVTMMGMGIHMITDPEIEKQFSIKTVLSTLGQPEEIIFYLTGYGALGPEEITPYVIKLFYDNERTWMLIGYEGIALMQGDVLRFCPTDLRQGILGRVENDVGLTIQPGQNNYTPDDLDQMGGGGDPILSGKTFEEATGEDIASFYKKITSPGEDACFTTRKDIW